MSMSLKGLSLFIIALPIASLSWTITHEEVLREFRELCAVLMAVDQPTSLAGLAWTTLRFLDGGE